MSGIPVQGIRESRGREGETERGRPGVNDRRSRVRQGPFCDLGPFQCP